MTKLPDWPTVYYLMKAGKRQTSWGGVCVRAGMTELEGEGVKLTEQRVKEVWSGYVNVPTGV